MERKKRNFGVTKKLYYVVDKFIKAFSLSSRYDQQKVQQNYLRKRGSNVINLLSTQRNLHSGYQK